MVLIASRIASYDVYGQPHKGYFRGTFSINRGQDPM
jgi:hypothetical protein